MLGSCKVWKPRKGCSALNWPQVGWGGARREPIETPRRRRGWSVRIDAEKRVGGVWESPDQAVDRKTLRG
jgi:hypothetical protein